MFTVEDLKKYGADTDKGLSRCANNEALYLRLVKMCADELMTDALGEALRANDLDRAFDVAHKLKGGVNNLSLDPISVHIGELTELLRNKTPGDYDKLYGDIMEEAKTLADLVNG